MVNKCRPQSTSRVQRCSCVLATCTTTMLTCSHQNTVRQASRPGSMCAHNFCVSFANISITHTGQSQIVSVCALSNCMKGTGRWGTTCCLWVSPTNAQPSVTSTLVCAQWWGLQALLKEVHVYCMLLKKLHRDASRSPIAMHTDSTES